MKKFLYYILLLLTLSCDNIEEGNRLIEIETVNAQKRVLLEEFTGWRCVNCPEAAEVASILKKEYGENLILVSLHPINDINTDPANGIGPDFQTEEAGIYKDYFKPDGFPMGMIDRTNFNGKTLYLKDYWAAYVQEKLMQKATVDLNLEILENQQDNSTIIVKTYIKALEKLEFNPYLQLWLIENRIIAPQFTKGASGVNLEYEHNHVLRGAINGVWGEVVPELNIENEFTTEITNNYTINPNFNINNCTIVGFLYNPGTKEIIQSQEIAVINKLIE